MNKTDKKIAIEGKRLQVTARANGIDFEEDYYWEKGRRPNRVITGIIVAEKDEKAMRDAIAARDKKRRTPAQRAASRRARQEKEKQYMQADILAKFPAMPPAHAEECAHHASEIGSGRVGRSSTAEDPARAAVVAYVRHNFTEYDSLLQSGFDREEARRIVSPEIRQTLEGWE